MTSVCRILVSLLMVACSVQAYLPVVLWHGMGDSCCNPFSMGRIKTLIEEEHNGTYVYSVMVGNSIIQDTEAGFFMNVNDQIAQICGKIQADPLLANGYHAIGFSQGGQFLRGLVQRCPNPPMHNFISLGGQHQGVFGFPGCPEADPICEDIRLLLSQGAYIPAIQNHLVQAEYWHDSINETMYREGSIFIAEINQEKGINEDYRTNLQALDKFVLVKFLRDTMVIPQESSWFGFYTPGQDIVVQSLQESVLYVEDRLGLKAMDDAGKLIFLTYDGEHISFSDEWFLEEIVNVYLT